MKIKKAREYLQDSSPSSSSYCALSGFGGGDIAGGVCFKNPTGGDFRFFVLLIAVIVDVLLFSLFSHY